MFLKVPLHEKISKFFQHYTETGLDLGYWISAHPCVSLCILKQSQHEGYREKVMCLIKICSMQETSNASIHTAA